MEEKTMIPLIVYESALDKADRMNKRLLLIIALLIVLLAASNALWVYEWTLYDYVSDEYEVEVDSQGFGTANYIGEDGDIYNGTGNGKTQEDDANEKQ